MTGPAKPDGPPTGPPASARLLMSCADRPGIVAAVSSSSSAGANIVESDQYSTDPEGGAFFMRMEFDLGRSTSDRDASRPASREVAERFGMDWRLTYAGRAQAHRDPGLARRPLPARPALALAPRRARRRDRRSWSRTTPTSARTSRRFGMPVRPRARSTKDKKPEAEARMLELLAASASTWSCSRATCRSSAATSSRGSAPGDQHPPLVPAGLRRRRPLPRARTSAA